MQVSDTLRKGSALSECRVPFFSCCELSWPDSRGLGQCVLRVFRVWSGLLLRSLG